jgi:hypothetical protein
MALLVCHWRYIRCWILIVDWVGSTVRAPSYEMPSFYVCRRMRSMEVRSSFLLRGDYQQLLALWSSHNSHSRTHRSIWSIAWIATFIGHGKVINRRIEFKCFHSLLHPVLGKDVNILCLSVLDARTYFYKSHNMCVRYNQGIVLTRILCCSEDLLVLELDRLLKPGGIFASFSSQVATAEDVPAEVNKEQASICWSSLLEDDKSVFWQKAYNRTCYYSRYLLICLLLMI